MKSSDSNSEPAILLDYSPVKHRMENLDALRILCMFVIILTHVTEPFLDIQSKSGEPFGPLAMGILALNVSGRFGVPCFMMISFFIYWHQLYEKGRTWIELLIRRFKRLIPAFIVWSAFYFFVHKFLFKHHPSEFYTRLAETKYSLKSFHTFKLLAMGQAEYHLYYLPLVMQCLLCIPLLKLLWKKPAVAWAWILATAMAWIIMVYGPLFFSNASTGGKITERITKVMYQPWAIPFLIFPLFGMMCAGQPQWRRFIAHTNRNFWISILVVGLLLHGLEAIYLQQQNQFLPAAMRDFARVIAYIKVGRILTAFAVFVLFLRHPLMRDPMPKVSHYAFGLHFLHPFIIILITLTEQKILGPGISSFQSYAVALLTINLVLTLSITFGLCLIIGRIKPVQFLVV